MGFNKFLIVFTCLIFAGCATSQTTKTKKLTEEQSNSIYEQGYKDGVKENINGIVEKLNGNDFPYYGEWSEPIVQNVKVPASIQNGAFIPEHYQTIIIVPGEWKKNEGYPIKAQETENNKNENALQNVSVDVNNITVMPKQYSAGTTK